MSHFNTIKLQITDVECLVAALKMMFEEVEVHPNESPVGLWGYENRERPEKANIIVRRAFIGALSNDLGFAWNEETQAYDAIISEYDESLLGSEFVPNVFTFYSAFKAKKAGYLVGIPERQPNGTYRIPLQAPSKPVTSKLAQSSSSSSSSKTVSKSKFAQIKN